MICIDIDGEDVPLMDIEASKVPLKTQIFFDKCKLAMNLQTVEMHYLDAEKLINLSGGSNKGLTMVGHLGYVNLPNKICVVSSSRGDSWTYRTIVHEMIHILGYKDPIPRSLEDKWLEKIGNEMEVS